MAYPQAVLEKAQRLAQLLQRVAAARKQEDESLRAPQLAKEIEAKFGVTLTDGHINYLLRKRGLTAPPGRPYKREAEESASDDAPSDTASVENVGLFFPRGSQARDGPS
jgi:transposase